MSDYIKQVKWTEKLNSQTGIRKGVQTKFCEKLQTYITTDVSLLHSQVPKIKTNFVNEIYNLYPLLTNINSKVAEILGKKFHIDRLIHSLEHTNQHWRNMFDWNPIDDDDDENYYKHLYNRKGSYDSFKQEINSQAFGQLKCGLTSSLLPLREIEIAFNILESALKIAKDNDGELSYNFVGKSFDLTEDVIVSYDEIEEFISENLNNFISKFDI